MGACIYCGKSAGIFRGVHKKCEEDHARKEDERKRKEEIVLRTFQNSIYELIISGFDKSDVMRKIENVEPDMGFIPVYKAMKNSFDRAVDTLLDDGVLSDKEKSNLDRFVSFYSDQFKKLKAKHGWDVVSEIDNIQDGEQYQRFIKGAILSDIINGRPLEKRFTINESPIIFPKGESPLWLFNNVGYFTYKTKTEYRGSSDGISIRIAKGLYYRTGSFKGNPIRTEVLEKKKDGSLILTTKNIYFYCGGSLEKTPLSKIILAQTFADGILIQKDGMREKPKIFKHVDSWFISNVISNHENIP